jgi:hypothetical protein
MHRNKDKRPTPLRDSPFAYTRPVRPRGWLDRMLGRPRADLAHGALQHLLSQRDPAHISQADISALLIEYDVSGPAARDVLIQMWRRVLGAFLSDDAFSDREIAYLDALRDAFALTDEEVRESERQVVHPRYSVALHDALADTRLSDEERAVLARLAQHLRLPEAVQQELYARSTRSVIEGLLGRSTADRRLSPDELEQLASVARHLGVTRDFDGATEAMLDRYALFWRIENGDMPVVMLDHIPLDADETCHVAVAAQRHEPRASGDGAEVEGVGSVRIARGVYYRIGSASAERMNRASFDRTDTGRFIVTNKRVLFDGQQGSTTLGLRDISSYQVYADGIVLERRIGHGPWFTLEGDVELTAVILGAALARG